eukprot:TRINITY_DN514_c0_g1_i8.p1 TRINITY_DN514_c0_g1~~TRINITY_DN514_c0_g1_i8.p1  ORF type:complete len:332 (-),score=91.69 TRINITY_DN514_c0_g1_i8:1312-2307(-)
MVMPVSAGPSFNPRDDLEAIAHVPLMSEEHSLKGERWMRKGEEGAMTGGERQVHFIPVVVLLAAFILWGFSRDPPFDPAKSKEAYSAGLSGALSPVAPGGTPGHASTVSGEDARGKDGKTGAETASVDGNGVNGTKGASKKLPATAEGSMDPALEDTQKRVMDLAGRERADVGDSVKKDEGRKGRVANEGDMDAVKESREMKGAVDATLLKARRHLLSTDEDDDAEEEEAERREMEGLRQREERADERLAREKKRVEDMVHERARARMEEAMEERRRRVRDPHMDRNRHPRERMDRERERARHRHSNDDARREREALKERLRREWREKELK